MDPVTDRIIPFNFYALIFKEGLLTVSWKKLNHFKRFEILKKRLS